MPGTLRHVARGGAPTRHARRRLRLDVRRVNRYLSGPVITDPGTIIASYRWERRRAAEDEPGFPCAGVGRRVNALVACLVCNSYRLGPTPVNSTGGEPEY